MEKSSKIYMTFGDMQLFRAGILSERLAQIHSIQDITELAQIIKSGMYEIVDPLPINNNNRK